MDSDFMNNLASMLKNGNIPEEMKSKMNQFMSQNSDSTNQSSSSTDEAENASSNTNTMNPEMMQNLMKMFLNSSSSSSNNSQTENGKNSETSNFSGIDMNTILKMKSIMDKMQNSKNDPRSNLLLSLKPYLKETRKEKVEQYVQLLNMTKIMEAFHENGGEKIK